MALKKGMTPKHIQAKDFDHPGEGLGIVMLLERVEDPRRPSPGFKYSLVSVLFMVLVGMCCGAKDWSQVVELSEGIEEWLGEFVDMKEGVPCESTFINIFNAIEPEVLGGLLIELADHLREKVGREIIAFDGQSLRGTASPSDGKKALQLLHAWSVQNGICLGQMAIDAKTNEICVIPQLMELLDLKGAIVTADALNTQKEIAAKALKQGADYVLPVKANQPVFLDEIVGSAQVLREERALQQRLWEREVAKAKAHRAKEQVEELLKTGAQLTGIEFTEFEKAHGRLETRTYTFWSAKDIPSADAWEGLKTLGRVVRERVIGEKKTCETVYFISSLTFADHELMAEAIRRHWSIENSLHWRLDVAFRQDDSRYRHRVGATNLAILRKCALTALTKVPALRKRQSIAAKQTRASVDPTFRLNVILSLLKNSF